MTPTPDPQRPAQAQAEAEAKELLRLYTQSVLELDALMNASVIVPQDVQDRRKHEVHFLRDQILRLLAQQPSVEQAISP